MGTAFLPLLIAWIHILRRTNRTGRLGLWRHVISKFPQENQASALCYTNVHYFTPSAVSCTTFTVLRHVYRAATCISCGTTFTVQRHVHRATPHVPCSSRVPCCSCTMSTVLHHVYPTVLHYLHRAAPRTVGESVRGAWGASCSSSPLCRNWVYTSCLWPGRLSGRKWMGWNRPDRLIRDFLRLIINFRGMLPRPREEAPIDSF